MVNFPEDYAKQEKYYASESYQTYAKNAIDLSERDKKQAIIASYFGQPRFIGTMSRQTLTPLKKSFLTF